MIATTAATAPLIAGLLVAVVIATAGVVALIQAHAYHQT